ncbi:CLUMA_CG007798, isoform A, partial [Clunio marinus]
NISGEINFDILNDRNLIFHNYLIENIGKADQTWLSFRQYFLSTSDQGKIENCNYVPEVSHFTRLYASAIVNKRIILLVDQTSEQMDTTRAIAKTVVSALNDTDKVSIILIADKVTLFSRPDSCQSEVMTQATPTIKHKIYDFLDSANRTNGIANHTLGFQIAFDVINKLYKESNASDLLPISFLYVTEGVTDLFSDARNVLAEITIGQSRLPHPVIINICAIVANNRQFPTQTQFLHDIASQNFVKYGLDTSSWWHKKGDRSLNGQMFLMNRTMEGFQRHFLLCLTELFNYKQFINNQFTLHPPFYDADFSKDFIVSLTKTCDQRGVFGIDLVLNFLIEDVLYSNKPNSSYKFLTDMNGRTFSHSLLYPRPITLKETFYLVHIRLLEKTKGFDNLWEKMMKIENGSEILENFSYTWRHISNLMIVCIVTDVNFNNLDILQRIKTSTTSSHLTDPNKSLPELLYHRLDLVVPPNSINMCHYYKQTATFDAITLHLSSKAFSSPYSHIKSNKNEESNESQIQTVQNFMAYLRDTRNLFANPGLLDVIRSEVSGAYQIMEFLKKKHVESVFKKYIVRRYVASMNGVLQIFPGGSLDVTYEATRRPWFIKAMEEKGKIAITEPYLDAGGAGYVVSVSYAIMETKHSGTAKQPIAVVALDFTRGFFYRMLLEELEECKIANIKCLLMNDKGYLLAHPNVMESTSNDNHRQPEHITHKESHVANDILMQRKFVKKIACNDYLNGTSQRYYQFNTSINEIITNFANVEKTKYQIMSVKGTNLFVGIINSTSETSGAFCPCSTIDFRCLNCYRMEQIECECPCECRLEDSSSCLMNKTDFTETSSSCSQRTELIQNYQTPIVKDVIDSCNLFNCDMFSEKEDCLGVIGCVWCHTNDDETPLSIPFCAAESTCYNGVFGSFGDGYNIVIDSVMNYNFLPPTYSAILPVIGVILLLFLVVGFAMYCYRINYDNNGFGEHLYADSQDNNCIGMMQMSRFDYDDHPMEENHDMTNSLNQSLLNTNENAIGVQSPYRIATNYRHPNGYTDSSDHGYSTMGTHQDDSEQQVSISNRHNNNKRFSLSDSASINTSISSPQNNQPYDLSLSLNTNATRHLPSNEQTQILSPKRLSPHQVIAEVTVHRMMEST